MRWDIMMMMMTIDFDHVTGLRCCGFLCYVLLILSYTIQHCFLAFMCRDSSLQFAPSDRSHLILIKHRSGPVLKPLHNWLQAVEMLTAAQVYKKSSANLIRDLLIYLQRQPIWVILAVARKGPTHSDRHFLLNSTNSFRHIWKFRPIFFFFFFFTLKHLINVWLRTYSAFCTICLVK